eukprot:184084_1
MTETQNVATYARIRPYNPAINEDKRLTARASQGNKILNQNGANEDTYNFTGVFDMSENTEDVFQNAMKPLLDYKILQGINSIFIVYGQSGSGKSFTLIGEPGHLGVLPMSLQYLLEQDNVESIHVASIEAYGIKAAKIGFYDLVSQLKEKKANKKKFDPYASKDNSRLDSSNAQRIQITKSNCLKVITSLQEVSHMAPTLKNPHSSRGHTVYFNQVKMKGLEDVYFIAVDLAGSEGQTALGTKDEFVNGLKLAMSKGKLKLNKRQMKGFEEMYKTRSLEAGCINNGLTQLQSIFGELIKKKISKARGLGLRKVLSSFISLSSAYAVLFTLSASANNNKVTRATLNFAKQTQLVKVETQKAKAKIDKVAVIKELNELIEELKKELKEKNKTVQDLQKELAEKDDKQYQIRVDKVEDDEDGKDEEMLIVFERINSIRQEITEAEVEEAKWTMSMDDGMEGSQMSLEEMKSTFDEFDEDGGGTIDAEELSHALKKMGQALSMDEVHKLITEVDANGDGEIDINEFKVMVEQSWFINAFQGKLVQSVEAAMNRMDAILEDEDDEEDHVDWMEELKEKDDTIQNLENELVQMKEKTKQMDELRAKNAEYSETALSLHKLLSENEELKSKMSAVQSENESLRTKAESDNSEVKSNVAALQKQNEIELLKNTHMESERMLQKQVEKLNDELKEMQSQNESLQNENTELQNANMEQKEDYMMTAKGNDEDVAPPVSTGCCGGFSSFFNFGGKGKRASQAELLAEDEVNQHGLQTQKDAYNKSKKGTSNRYSVEEELGQFMNVGTVHSVDPSMSEVP